MQITKKNAKRLTSLAALGAGALALGTGEAKADVIYVDLSGNPGKVGFDSGYGVSFNISIPWQNGSSKGTANIAFRNLLATNRGNKYWEVYAWGGANGTRLPVKREETLLVFGKGGTRASRSTSSSGSARRALIAGRLGKSRSSSTFWNGSFTNQYALFEFSAGSQTDYGWIELSNSVSADPFGPDVTISAFAYDTTGKQLPAGAGETPEPSTLAMAGLGALALGAVGVRRWRKARN